MKYFKFSFLFLSLTYFFLISCQKEEKNASSNVDFSIKDMNGKEVNYLNPEVLLLVKKTLISEGRNEDVKKLISLYDFNTGLLKSSNIKLSELTQPTLVILDSSKIGKSDTVKFKTKSGWQPQGVYVYAHIQDLGSIGPFTQCDALWTNFPYPYCGTTGQGKRLEAFTLQTDPSLISSRPTIYYALRKPDQSWWASATWGQETGVQGRSFTNIGLKMWSTTSGWHLYYIAHNDVVGWNQPWQYDGAFAGVIGRRFEAFAFQILKF